MKKIAYMLFGGKSKLVRYCESCGKYLQYSQFRPMFCTSKCHRKFKNRQDLLQVLGSLIFASILTAFLFIASGCSGGNSSSGKQQRYQGSDEFISAMTQAESKYKAGRVAQINEGGTPYLASYDRTYNVIRFSSQWRQYENDDIAGILAHENTHAKQPASKNHNHAVEKELAAFRVQVQFLQSIGRHDLSGKWAAMDGRHVCE